MDKIGRRRSDRILAPVRIWVAGKDATGEDFEEEAVTVSINKHGAAISLTHMLVPEQRLQIRNLENGIEATFRVVGELRQVFGERREWGVEVLNPESKIWGMDFTPPPEGVEPKALIACAECQTALLTAISSIEYDVLLHTGVMSRHCERCGQTTRWRPGEQGAAAGEAGARAEPPPGVVERRKHRRTRVTMLVRVRDRGGKTETVQTVDASKGGISFVSKSAYKLGDEISVTLPFTTGDTPKESKARILRCQPGPRGTLYAVSFAAAEAREAVEAERGRSRWGRLRSAGPSSD
jgi:hypothetical protein